MKQLLIKIADWLIVIVALLIVLIAVLLSLARLFLPHMTQYQSRIENWASQTLHQPVHIGEMEAAWRGLHPEFKFSNVEVLDTTSTRPLVKINELDIGINLLKSLIHWRIEPGLLIISGVNLSIHQDATGKITINGIMSAGETPSQIKAGDAVNWLLTQNRIYLENANVTWYGKNGVVLPFHQIKIRFINSILSHQLLGAAVLQEAVPTHFRFVMNIDGDVLRDKNFQARFYLRVHNFLVPAWLKNQSFAGFKLVSGVGNFELWGNWGNQQLQNVQLVFVGRQIGLQTPYLTQGWLINRASGNIFWQRITNGWSLAGKNLLIRLNNKDLPKFSFNFVNTLAQNSQPSKRTFQMDVLSIEEAKKLLLSTTLLSDKNKQRIMNLNPTGELSDFIFTYTDKMQNQPASYHITSGFDELSWSRWEKIPGVKKLTGVIDMKSTDGKLTLKSEETEFDFGSLFRRILPLDNLQATVTWQKVNNGWQITSPNIVAQNSAASIHSDMNIYLPTNSSPIVNVLTGFDITNPKQALQYMPVGIMPKGVVTWVDHAVLDAKDVTGNMVLSGPMSAFPFKHNEGRFIIDSQLYDVDLHYRDGWPDINDLNGNLVFDDNSMLVNNASGKIFNTIVSNIKATLPDMGNPILQIQGNATGNLNDALQFLQKSPLNKSIGKQLQGFEMRGPLNLVLQLGIPLKVGDVTVRGEVSTQKAELLIPQLWNINVKDLQGNLQFTANSLTGNLQGSFFGEPLNVNIKTLHPTPKTTITQFDLGNGQMTLKQITKRFDLPEFPYAQGTLNYHALLEFYSDKNSFNILKINSDLQGIAVNLPAPFNKPAKQSLPSQLQIQFANQQIQMLFNYGQLLSTALTFQRNLQNQFILWGGEITLGGQQASYQTVPGILIDGKLPSFSWSEWKPILLPDKTVSTARPNLRAINVTFGKLDAFGWSLSPVDLQLKPSPSAWQVSLKSPNIGGQLTIPNTFPEGILVGNFQYLYFPSGQKAAPSLSPVEIPAMQIKTKSLRYGNKNLGFVDLYTEPSGQNGLAINHIRISSSSFSLGATGTWVGTGSDQQTQLRGTLNSQNLGNFLTAWNLTKNLAGAQGQANFDLQWQGAPYQPDAKSLTGTMHMDFSNGRIINLSPSTEAELGIGRVLNLLSLQTIPRRLRLDFSDLTDEGFSFDVMRGDFSLKEGSAYTTNAYIDGPVAKVLIKGRIGLASEDYNLDLFVTPYITSSIPAVVATVAGGPIAGAIAWLAGRIVSPAVGHFVTYTYHVTGSWSNPKVEKIE